MANVVVSNTFVNGTTAQAADVNTNFTDVVSYINTHLIRADYSDGPAFGYVPTGPNTDPTSANHLTRKSYVDALVNTNVGIAATRTVGATSGALTPSASTYQSIMDVTATVPNGKAVKVIAWASGLFFGHNNTAEFSVRLGISLTGAAGGLTYSTQAFGIGTSGGKVTPHAQHLVAGTTSATTVLCRLDCLQTTTFLASAAAVFEPTISVIVVPATALTL